MIRIFSIHSILKQKEKKPLKLLKNNVYSKLLQPLKKKKQLKFWFLNGQNFYYKKSLVLRKNCFLGVPEIAKVLQPRDGASAGNMQCVEVLRIFGYLTARFFLRSKAIGYTLENYLTLTIWGSFLFTHLHALQNRNICCFVICKLSIQFSA